MKEEYKEYLEEKVAPHINDIAKERDYTKPGQIQQLLKSIKEMMCCETTAYFTPRTLGGEQFFIPEGYFFSETSFPQDIQLDYHSAVIQKPLTSGKYLLKDSRASDKIISPLDRYGIQSLIATPTENEFSYGVLFAFNGIGIEKSQFNPSFNILQCNLFLLISKIIDIPTTYEMNLREEIRALNDQPLIGYFFSSLASLKGNEKLLDGVKTYYRTNDEICFLLLTPTKILSIVQTQSKSKCNTFFFSDII